MKKFISIFLMILFLGCSGGGGSGNDDDTAPAKFQIASVVMHPYDELCVDPETAEKGKDIRDCVFYPDWNSGEFSYFWHIWIDNPNAITSVHCEIYNLDYPEYVSIGDLWDINHSEDPKDYTAWTWWSPEETPLWACGEYNFDVWAVDNHGNETAIYTFTFFIGNDCL